MNVRVCVVYIICGSLASLLAACGRSASPLPPALSAIHVVTANSTAARVAAGPGSADGGSEVTVLAPALGSGAVAADGSFSFAVVLNAATTVTVSYVKSGEQLSRDVSVTTLASRVTTPLFSTGAGPNDLLFANDSLYVANSLDNTVTRHSIAGDVLASASFPQFASPSYLAAGPNIVYVIRNGDNLCTGLDALTLHALDPVRELPFANPAAAPFLGPGTSIVLGDRVITPFAGITDFGPPTLYDATGGDVIDFATGTHMPPLQFSGENGQQSVVSPIDDSTFYVITAGALQFDENFSPFVTSDSYLDVFSISSSEPVASLNLGMIAASGLTISADGATGFITSLINGNLYRVELAELSIERGENNPIVLTEEFTYISDVAFTPDGELLLATSFNTDELFVVDPLTNTVNPGSYPAAFDLALDPGLLAGCAAVEVNRNAADPERFSAYVLYGVANAVARVDLL